MERTPKHFPKQSCKTLFSEQQTQLENSVLLKENSVDMVDF